MQMQAEKPQITAFNLSAGLDNFWAEKWPDLFTKDPQDIAEGEALLVPFARWHSLDKALASAGALYLWLDVNIALEKIAPLLPLVKGVQVHFDHFSDGRGFSIAMRLRRDLAFKGEIRASGSILPDQALFLKRAGFDSAAIDPDRQDAFITALRRYDHFYQQDSRSNNSAAFARFGRP